MFVLQQELPTKRFDEDLKKRFSNTYKFSNHDINRFPLLLQNVIYSYNYMDGWEKFNEVLPAKEDFYSNRVYLSIVYLLKS